MLTWSNRVPSAVMLSVLFSVSGDHGGWNGPLAEVGSLVDHGIDRENGLERLDQLRGQGVEVDLCRGLVLRADDVEIPERHPTEPVGVLGAVAPHQDRARPGGLHVLVMTLDGLL